MKHRTLALLACGLLAQAGAQAATYVADLAGDALHITNNGNQDFAWTGQVTVVVDGALDGTYTGATLESIALVTNVSAFDFTFLKGQTLVPYYYTMYDYILVGPEAGASVTIADGKLAGLDLTEDFPYANAVLSGMGAYTATVCKFDLECQGAPDGYLLQGTFTALAAPLPEPSGAALLLAGLAMAGAAVRRRASVRPRLARP
jgi:hypothetical protein